MTLRRGTDLPFNRRRHINETEHQGAAVHAGPRTTPGGRTVVVTGGLAASGQRS
ncbi:hypothetical protein LV779_24840 [Streptomyces thinghirensis]|nr:hypothetical protein [Streptomyces thinghirensis]